MDASVELPDRSVNEYDMFASNAGSSSVLIKEVDDAAVIFVPELKSLALTVYP